MDISTARVEPHEIAKSEDFEFGFQSLIRNVAVLDRVLTAAGGDYIYGGEVSAVPGTMNLTVGALWANGGGADLPSYLSAESGTLTAVTPTDFSRRDTVQVRGTLESFDSRQRAFFDPELNRAVFKQVDTKNRLTAEIVLKKGTEGSSRAPDTDSGYVKIAEIHVDPETFALTPDCVKNVTAVNRGEENAGWTNEKAGTFRPAAGGLADLSARIHAEVRARREADEKLARRLDGLPIATETTPGFVRSSENDGEVSVSPYTGAMTADARIPVSGDLGHIFRGEEWDVFFRAGVPLGVQTSLGWPLQIAGGSDDVTVEGVNRGGGRAFRIAAAQNWAGIDVLHTTGSGADGRIPYRAGDRITVRIESETANQFILNADNGGWDQLAFAQTGAGGGSVALVHTVTEGSLARIAANSPPGVRIRGNAAGATFFITEILVERGARRRFSEIMQRTARELNAARNEIFADGSVTDEMIGARAVGDRSGLLQRCLDVLHDRIADAEARDQRPLAGTDTAIGADGRTVNATNQRPAAGSGISVNDRTVSIPAGGVTDAMLGNRTVQNPAAQTGTHSQNLTQIANNAAAAIRALGTRLDGFQELTETDIDEIIARKEMIELIIAELQGTSAEALAEIHRLIDGLTARDHRPLAGTDTSIGPDGRTVNAANQRPLAGSGITVNDRTVNLANHAASNANFGAATDSNWGHVKLGGNPSPADTGMAFPIGRHVVPAGGSVNLDEFLNNGYTIFTGGAAGDTNVLNGPAGSGVWLRGTTHSQFALRVWHSAGGSGSGTRQMVWRCGTVNATENPFQSDVFTRFRGNAAAWSPWTRVPLSIVNEIAAAGGDNVAASVSAVRSHVAPVSQAVTGVSNPATNAERVQLTRANGGAALNLPQAVGGTEAAGREGMMSAADKRKLDGIPNFPPERLVLMEDSNPVAIGAKRCYIERGEVRFQEFTGGDMAGGWRTIAALGLAAGLGFMACETPVDGERIEVLQNVFGSISINSVAFGNGRWVAAGFLGSVATSTNGTTWTMVADPGFEASFTIRSVAFGNGRWVAAGLHGRMATSTNGTTWTMVADPGFGAEHIHSVAHDGNGRWVAVGTRGRMATSTNGTTWTMLADPGFGANHIYSVAFGNGRWVAVGTRGRMATSTNGTTWTMVANSEFGGNFNSVAFDNGRWVAVGTSGRMVSWLDDDPIMLTRFGFTEKRIAGNVHRYRLSDGRWMVFNANGTVTWSES